MKLSIVTKKNIQHFNIPNNIIETYTINFKDNNDMNNFLTLENSNNVLFYKSNEFIQIIKIEEVQKEVIIKNNIFFEFIISGKNEKYGVFIFNEKDEFIKLLNDNEKELTIGKINTNTICFNFNRIEDIHCILKKVNNKFQLETNGRTFCNDVIVEKKFLTIGEIIFIEGLEIIFMGSFIYIKAFDNSLININNIEILGEINCRDYDKNAKANIINAYNENEYFYHTPRMREIPSISEINIDSPPESKEKEEVPEWISSLTKLTMIAFAFTRAYTVYDGIYIDGDPWSDHITNIVLCIASLLGSLVAPIIIAKYKKNMDKKYEKKRVATYTEYLLDRERLISNAVNEEKQILLNENISAFQSLNVISNKTKAFWSKRYKDDDFLSVRLGLGEINSSLKITGPERHFSIDKDELLESVFKLIDKYNKFNGVPILYSFKDHKITSIISESTVKTNFIKQMVLQIITSHSPMDVKLIIYTTKEDLYKWEFLKTVPHIFSDDNSIRFIVIDEESGGEVYKNVLDLIKKDDGNELKAITFRKKEEEINSAYYLIITDNFKKYKNDSLINYVLHTKEDENKIFSLLILEANMKNIPSECTDFIELGDKSGIILNTNINSKDHHSFLLEDTDFEEFKQCSSLISQIPMSIKNENSELPAALSFLKMYSVSKIEQLNILNRWKENNPVNSLSAIVGVHKSGEVFKLNLHEKNHGPHGLIAGSTGSGKSEFIITYILSMAIEYHPYEVQFVLIDYKGGGLAGAFENKKFGIRLPHLVGTITNLDVAEMNRTLVSIRSEVKRRQMIFNKCREKLNESTIDIYKYQRFYRDGLVDEPMSHLFIISDEFAELKSQRPEFMTEIISVARIGRSLGVHLILATQKPSGVVNEQIWSNSKFKVCLKVQSVADSKEMLKRPEAASLKEAGRFYLQVGYDEYFEIGQSGWSGEKYVPSNKVLTKVDNSIVFINELGSPIKSIKVENKEIINEDNVVGDQLTNIVKTISQIGENENIKIQNLWLEAIPNEIYLEELLQKYKYEEEENSIKSVIGEYDIPKLQKQELLTINLVNGGNTLICGQSGSGKDMLITSMLYSMFLQYSPEDLNVYIIDCSSQVLKKFESFPHVGAFMSFDSGVLVEDLLVQIDEEINSRKEKFVNYGGSYFDYLTKCSEKLPLIVIVVHGLEIFSENYINYLSLLQNISRDGEKLGIVVILSALSNNAVKLKLLQNFHNLIALQLASDSDYRLYLNCDRMLIPRKTIGRGLAKIGNDSFEFQTSYIANMEDEFEFLKNVSKDLCSKYIYRAKKVLTVPEEVHLSLFNEVLSETDNLPVGFDIHTRKIHFYNFLKSKVLMIGCKTIDVEKITFINSLLISLERANNKVLILDSSKLVRNDIPNVTVVNKLFSESLLTFIKENAEFDKFIFMVGIGAELDLDKKLSEYMEALVSFDKNKNILNFIIVDTPINLNKILTKEYIFKAVDKNNGIWLGPEVANQSIINISKLDRTDSMIKVESIAYFVRNKSYSVVKHIVEDIDE